MTTSSAPSKNSGVKRQRETERKLRAVRQEMERRAYEADLLHFTTQAWSILEPTRPFVRNWHHEVIAEHLTAVLLGKIRRLIVNVPPRCTKSRLITVSWPCWCWTMVPDLSWIFSSYNYGLSVHQHSSDRRTILESPWYAERWGHQVEIAEGENRQGEYKNTKRGEMKATSTGGGVMGMGGDIIVVDDPSDPEQVLSETERERANRYFDQTLFTRQRDAEKSSIVIVMQRLHDADLTGHVLEASGEDWVHLKIPQTAPARTVYSLPISKTKVVREEGSLMWPERFGPKQLAESKRVLGSWAYSGQMQQEPSPEGGGIYHRDWWHFWGGPDCPRCDHGHGLPSTFTNAVQSWDCTFKDTDGSDYVSGQAWAKTMADYWLLDRVNARMDFPATIAAIQTFSGKWAWILTKLIEDKANGPAVVSSLRRKVSGLIPVEPLGGKIARAHSTAPLVEAGNVYLPHPTIAPWVHDFIEQHAAFPKAAHDDDVDAQSQALARLSTAPGQGMFEYYGQEAARVQQLQENPNARKPRFGFGETPKNCPSCGSHLVRATTVGHWQCLQCGVHE